MHSALDTSSLHNCGVALQENTLQSMQSLLKFAQLKKVELPLELEPLVNTVLHAGCLTKECAGQPLKCFFWHSESIEQLWRKDETLQYLYYHKGHRCTGMLPSAAHYYFENAVRFAGEDFKPSPEDIPCMVFPLVPADPFKTLNYVQQAFIPLCSKLTALPSLSQMLVDNVARGENGYTALTT